MNKYRDIIRKIFIIILGLILIGTGSGVILLSLPITSTIANLAKDNHIIYAFLWSILLLFTWAVGASMFIIGVLVHKLNDDDDDNNTCDDKITK